SWRLPAPGHGGRVAGSDASVLVPGNAEPVASGPEYRIRTPTGNGFGSVTRAGTRRHREASGRQRPVDPLCRGVSGRGPDPRGGDVSGEGARRRSEGHHSLPEGRRLPGVVPAG